MASLGRHSPLPFPGKHHHQFRRARGSGIEVNPKDTELTHVRAGMIATVNIDTGRQRQFSDVVTVLFGRTTAIAANTR
jgi:multidrug resistance efflux pump